MYTTDQQQVEQFHLWWKKNGTSTILMFVVALSISFGWRFWVQHQEVRSSQASANYEQLLNSEVNNDSTNVVNIANYLMENYSHTPYAPLAALMLARQSVYQGNFADAEDKLVWVTHHAKNKAICQVARLRAARILLAQNQPQQALLMLNKIDDPAYLPAIDEIKGDCNAALGRFGQARQFYDQATQVLPGYEIAQPILRMKLNNLPVSNAPNPAIPDSASNTVIAGSTSNPATAESSTNQAIAGSSPNSATTDNSTSPATAEPGKTTPTTTQE